MGILDYPVGDGDATQGERLIGALTSALLEANQPAVLVLGLSVDEPSWLVSQVIQRNQLALSLSCVLRAADPFTPLRKILDWEGASTSIYALREKSLLLIERLHHLPSDKQHDVLSMTIEACRMRRAKVVLTCEYSRSPIAESTDSIRVIGCGSFPISPEVRAPLIRELLEVALGREKYRASPKEMDQIVTRIATLDLPSGFWQVDRLVTAIARNATATGTSNVEGLVAHGYGRSVRPAPPLIGTDSIAQGLARLDGHARQLNRASAALDKAPAVAFGHLPPNPDLCSLPQHWFEAIVARWYAFYYDGGPRLAFIDRLDIRQGERLVHMGRGVSTVPPLLQALRTWQAHALDPLADRAQRQRARIDEWFIAKCGTAKPSDFHWRGLTIAVIGELERYLAHLTRATVLLARHPQLIASMRAFIQSENARRTQSW